MARVQPPGPALLLAEGRALLQFASLWPLAGTLADAPRGDGHPVLVLPGLFLLDEHTLPLRAFLATRGYAVHGWGAGLNRGDWGVLEAHLLPLLDALHRRHGRRVSLVGWSMGGVFARALARRRSDAVRCVVTLGTLLSPDARQCNVWPMFERVSAQPLQCMTDAGRQRAPLPVPATAVFSRTEGINHWQACLQPPSPLSENVEVDSSHHGLAYSTAVLRLVADRLAQPEGAWRPLGPGPGWTPLRPEPRLT